MVVIGLLPSSTVPYIDLLYYADECAARSERTAAAVAYRDAATLQPGDPRPYLRLARLYLDWGYSREAMIAIVQAEQRGAAARHSGPLWVSVYTARGEWPAALEHAHRWLAALPATDSESRAARHALAHTYLELRDWGAAVAEYEALVTTDSTDATAHERLGILLLDGESATAHLQMANRPLATRVLAAYRTPPPPGNPAGRAAYASALVGGVLLEAQEWALAAYHFERAVVAAPNYSDAHAYLGYALDRMGYPGEARLHLRQAVALAPHSPAARLLLGLHYDRLGQIVAARAEYEAAYDLDPHNPVTCIEIGETWAAEGNYLVAEIWLREAVLLRPDDPKLWETLTRFYLDHGLYEREEATESLHKLVALAPDEPATHELQGRAALQRGDDEAAWSHFLEAATLDPGRATAYYYLGLVRKARGERAEARAAFIRALDLDTAGMLTARIEREEPAIVARALQITGR